MDHSLQSDLEGRPSNKRCSSFGPRRNRAGYLRSNSAARGRHKLESVLNSLDSRLRTQRACFHLRVLILPARGKTCRIESAFGELEYPNILTVRSVSIGFRHEGRVDHGHGCKIGKPVALVNRLGHRRAEKIDVMR